MLKVLQLQLQLHSIVYFIARVLGCLVFFITVYLKIIAGNLSFFAGDLDKKGSFNEAIKGCEGVVVCALPESPR